jgi:tRNA threonylcarbamoyladenosine biosynthesis protein TsaB
MLLALDTSTQTVGMALYDGMQIIGETIWQTHSHHTVEVAPALGELFNRCAIRPMDLEGIGVALGPGSFTSLRIGLAIAKGLAMAVHIPIIGIPTLNILAAALPLSELPLAAVLQAGRNRLAVGWYQAGKHGWESAGEPQVITVDDLYEKIQTPTLLCGELTPAERQTLGRKRKTILLSSPAMSLRRPSFLAELAWKRLKSGKVDEVISLAPIYLHTAEAIPS